MIKLVFMLEKAPRLREIEFLHRAGVVLLDGSY